jgi:hypothetical protein
VGGAVCGMQRPIHVADEISSKRKGLLYLWATNLYEGTSCCSLPYSTVARLLKQVGDETPAPKKPANNLHALS